MSQKLVQYSSSDSSEGAPLTDEEESERGDEECIERPTKKLKRYTQLEIRVLYHLYLVRCALSTACMC